MATLLPNAVQQFLDANGVPLASGLVYMYVPGTTDAKDTWQDSSATTLNTNPIVLDASGEAIIFGAGIYRQQVYDSGGNLIWDQLTSSTDAGGLSWGGTSTGSANAQVIAASSFTQQDGQQISFIVGPGLTNTGALTVAPGGGTGISVLLNATSGPQPLAGGEVVAGNEVTLVYDATRGAFHIVNPAFGALSGVTITASTITASTIVLKQASDPTPTDEGDLEWSTLFNTFKVGDGASTQRFWPNVAAGLLYGCTLSNGTDATNDIDFAAGLAVDSTNAFYMTAGALTKQLDNTWAVGTNQGGLFSGSASNTTYHCFIIMRPDTGAVDAGFDTSVIAANRPASYTYYRRVGSFTRSGGVNVGFIQNGDTFWLTTPVQPVAATNPGTSAVTRTMTGMPTGVAFTVMVGHGLVDLTIAAATYGLLSPLATTDSTPSASIFDAAIGSGGATADTSGSYRTILTNTSAQIRSRISQSTADHTEFINLYGWVDNRGRLA